MTSDGLQGVVTHTADPAASLAAPGSAPRPRTEQVLCIDGDRSFTVTLPPSGELVIGRGPDAGLSVDDPLVSRAHAQLLVVPDGLRLADLGSRHGTYVNGERVLEPRLVGSGDVIAIGNALLVVRRPVRAAGASSVTEQPVLVQRLAEELARCAQYERELSLVIARTADGDAPALLAAIADRLRVIDTAAIVGARFVGVLLPEVGADEAHQFARALSARGVGAVSAGVATAPYDGIDADAVLGAARAACSAAGAGAVVRARDAAEVLTAGAQRILVADPAMSRLYELARRLARATIPILVLGETGSGKELAAAAIHASSARAAGPFISVNCAAIPESLAESELFGHARGAFSGALAARAGTIEAASGGTLFLDEIGELSPAIQAKLLRVLESGELVRVGETQPRSIDLRLVAATNRDLSREVDEGRFRSDLYFRLGAARLELPPLRDRPRDVALLAHTMLGEACRRLERPPLELSIGAAIALYRHEWPGNVRELRHVIEYAAAAARDDAREIEIWHLPAALAATARNARDAARFAPEAEPSATPAAPGAGPPAAPPAPDDARAAPALPEGAFRPIADEVRELERARMLAALRATGGVQNRAAALIEMPLRTFVTKVKRYAITPAEWGGV
ncbi:MAG TPA: sigma 54-interacting transcriptional regulator [Kofleriaceae bacterium]|nr:sigma 54-interacting transcriptional regulator [Kofleriaceae bacterium]